MTKEYPRQLPCFLLAFWVSAISASSITFAVLTSTAEIISSFKQYTMVPRFSQSSDGHSESSFRRTPSISSKGPYIPIKRGSSGSEILENIAIEQSRPIEKAKVAIPRHRTGVVPRNPGRVLRACESCRSRKTKCSGDNPVCRQCHELKAACVYPLAFRERTKQ